MYPAIGDKIEAFTVIGVHPLVLQCECGKVVHKRTPYHLSHGLKSCGCKRNIRPISQAYLSPEMASRMEVVKILSPDDYLFDNQVFAVRCKLCRKISTMSRAGLRYRGKIKFGCRLCWHRNKNVQEQKENRKAHA